MITRDERLVLVEGLSALVRLQVVENEYYLAGGSQFKKTEEADALKRHLVELGAFDIANGGERPNA